MSVNNFSGALSGRGIRKRITRGHDDALFLIFAEDCADIYYYGLLYADEYAAETSRGEIVIVTADEAVRSAAESMVGTKKTIVLLSGREMEKLLLNLSLHVDLMGQSVYENFIIISEKHPYGAGFAALRELGAFPDSYLVWNRIFHYRDVYYAKEPETLPRRGDISSARDQE